ncbi:unnamed protein product, partial [marine sediment metagenome]
MKRHPKGIMKMNKIAILSIILAMAVGLGGCTTINPPASPTTESAPAETAPATGVAPPTTATTIPAPPEVPQEVLLIWKSAAPSGVTPNLSGELILEPNKAKPSGQTFEVISTAGSNKDSEVFYLDKGQWADILVSCSDMPIYYLSEESGAAHLVVCHWATQPDKPDLKGRAYFEPDMGIFNP